MLDWYDEYGNRFVCIDNIISESYKFTLLFFSDIAVDVKQSDYVNVFCSRLCSHIIEMSQLRCVYYYTQHRHAQCVLDIITESLKNIPTCIVSDSEIATGDYLKYVDYIRSGGVIGKARKKLKRTYSNVKWSDYSIAFA